MLEHISLLSMEKRLATALIKHNYYIYSHDIPVCGRVSPTLVLNDKIMDVNSHLSGNQ